MIPSEELIREHPIILMVLPRAGQLARPRMDLDRDTMHPSITDSVAILEDPQALIDALDKVEGEELGEGMHEIYHALAHRLSAS